MVPDTAATVQFRYLAAEQAYEIQLPGLPAGRVQSSSVPGVPYMNSIVASGTTPGTQQAGVWLGGQPPSEYPPGPLFSELSLTYTRFGIWESGSPSRPGPHSGGYFAYGVPTAAGDVPTSGMGIFVAGVVGMTADGGTQIGGQARLAFDFGAGTLNGHMQPVWSPNTSPWDYESHVDLGRYEFTQTVYSAGSTAFSGRFIVPGGGAGETSFDGRFTGPQAAELMARWMAPYRNPASQLWSTMFGVWVGGRAATGR